jgi:hypothetical protein
LENNFSDMLTSKNKQPEELKNVPGFFHYAPEYFTEVWQSYEQIIKNSLPAKKIVEEISELFYIGQTGSNSSLPIISGLTQKQITTLMETGGYHIETPPLLHPAFTSAIAGVSGITEKQLEGIFNFTLMLIDGKIIERPTNDTVLHSGPQYVQTLLERKQKISLNGFEIKPVQLLITQIPILPQKKRPFISGILETAYPGVDNISYLLIARLAEKLLSEGIINSFSGIRRYCLLQQYFREMIIAVEYKLQDNKWAVLKKLNEVSDNYKSKEPLNKYNKTGTSPDTAHIPMYRNSYDAKEKNIPLDIICISDSEICLQYPEKTALYNIASGEEIMNVAVKNFKIHKINTTAKIIRFFGCHNSDMHQPSDFMYYDYGKKKWGPGIFPEDDYIELAHHTERNVLVNYKTGTEFMLPELADAPAKKIHSACGKYMFIEDKHGNGGLYSLASGLRVLSSDEIHQLPDDDIPVYEIAEKLNKTEAVTYSEETLKLARQKNRFELGAIVIDESSWTLLLHELVYHNGKPVCEINYPYSCAAFNKEGSVLFLANLYGLIRIDVNSYFKSAEMKYVFLTMRTTNSEP